MKTRNDHFIKAYSTCFNPFEIGSDLHHVLYAHFYYSVDWPARFSFTDGQEYFVRLSDHWYATWLICPLNSLYTSIVFSQSQLSQCRNEFAKTVLCWKRHSFGLLTFEDVPQSQKSTYGWDQPACVFDDTGIGATFLRSCLPTELLVIFKTVFDVLLPALSAIPRRRLLIFL